jgi:hypothetical protein
MSANSSSTNQIRRTALVLAAVALLFYLGFILLGVLRS